METIKDRYGNDILSEKILRKSEFQEYLKEKVNPQDRESLEKYLNLLILGHIRKRDDRERKGQGILEVPLPHLHLIAKLSNKFKTQERKNEILAHLYSLGAAYTLENIKNLLQSEKLKKLFFELRTLDLSIPAPELIRYLKKLVLEFKKEGFYEDIDMLFKWLETLKAFSREKIILDPSQASFPIPFNNIYEYSKEWRDLLEISMNFGHALKKSFNIGNIFVYLQEISEIELGDEEIDPLDPIAYSPRYLHYQSKALHGFLELITGYQRELLQVEEDGNINNWQTIFEDVRNLLNALSFEEADDLAPLPIQYPDSNDKKLYTELRHADKYQILRAIYEIAKGAFGKGKIDRNKLKRYRAYGEPYLEMKVLPMLDNHNNEMICVSLVDKGAHINIPEIENIIGRKAKNLSDIIDLLSKKGISIPAPGQNQKIDENKGLGLYTARNIIKEHKGDLFCNNAKEGEVGVGFLFVIPKEGKRSLHKLCLEKSDIEVRQDTVSGIISDTSEGVSFSIEVPQNLDEIED